MAHALTCFCYRLLLWKLGVGSYVAEVTQDLIPEQLKRFGFKFKKEGKVRGSLTDRHSADTVVLRRNERALGTVGALSAADLRRCCPQYHLCCSAYECGNETMRINAPQDNPWKVRCMRRAC
jgi:hypothetical protein